MRDDVVQKERRYERMKFLKRLMKKKGVSPVIAVVLMIAVAVAIAVIVYAWASGFTSEKTGAESGEAEQLVLENQKLSSTTLQVCIRNALNTPATLDAEYDDKGDLIASGINTDLDADSVTCVTLAGSYTPGDDCMLVTEQGTQIKFKVKG
jgi:flagellin-like protein